ncbi:hypothetical protein CKA32_003243 [Geitlerinema sp. FC II]|nr:hypothetical protein CKA32_003243 [Geitlerinema sp. FC II]
MKPRSGVVYTAFTGKCTSSYGIRISNTGFAQPDKPLSVSSVVKTS